MQNTRTKGFVLTMLCLVFAALFLVGCGGTEEGSGEESASAEEEALVTAVRSALVSAEDVDGAFDVEAEGGTVTLGGTAGTLLEKEAALRAAADVEGVDRVIDELTVRARRVDDEHLKNRIERAVTAEPSSNYAVEVGVASGAVTLTGAAETSEDKIYVRRIVAGVPGVRSIDNQLVVDRMRVQLIRQERLEEVRGEEAGLDEGEEGSEGDEEAEEATAGSESEEAASEGEGSEASGEAS